ncbi:hypothetical protein EV424DRAFT_133975 [Suillus variegatus]|nr:hypothetical protein EV424DRAFT_133975 [Suillus variegatus]
MSDSERLPTIESLQGIDSASESKHILPYDKQKTEAGFDRELQTRLNEAPDGGIRAWLSVFAAALVTFSTFGLLNSWGIFQAYYEENLLLHTPPSTM